MTLEETLAIAICKGFWEDADRPERWETTPEHKRQVFRNCARHAIAEAQRVKAARQAKIAEGANAR